MGLPSVTEINGIFSKLAPAGIEPVTSLYTIQHDGPGAKKIKKSPLRILHLPGRRGPVAVVQGLVHLGELGQGSAAHVEVHVGHHVLKPLSAQPEI